MRIKTHDTVKTKSRKSNCIRKIRITYLKFLFDIEHFVLVSFPFTDVREVGSQILYNGFVT